MTLPLFTSEHSDPANSFPVVLSSGSGSSQYCIQSRYEAGHRKIESGTSSPVPKKNFQEEAAWRLEPDRSVEFEPSLYPDLCSTSGQLKVQRLEHLK